MILGVRGSQVGGPNRSKSMKKMKPRCEGILALTFCGFWWGLGRKLGRKVEPKSIPRGIEKNDERIEDNKMDIKSEKELTPPSDQRVQGLGDGVGG